MNKNFTPQEQLALIKKGTLEIISEEELLNKLKAGRPLKVKFGADPSAPDLHLGHLVVLRKLRQFQDLGHEVQFLIGDFTAMIGDPSGRNETRPPLSAEQVAKNAKTYKDQIDMVLDPKKTKMVFNRSWLSKMSMEDVIKLTGQYTIARILERADFKDRYTQQKDISLVEFIYPLLQGYDSVYLESDVEMGGSDQKFNLLVGRALQKCYGQESQVVIMTPILEGLDGVKKMSKSLGNYVGLTEPAKDIYGKLMSIPDVLMPRYYELLTDLTLDKNIHPKQAKMLLARTITGYFYGAAEVQKAEELFETVHKEGGLPEDIPEFVIAEGTLVSKAMVASGLASSGAEAQRLIKQSAVEIDGVKVTDEKAVVAWAAGQTEKIVKVGKRRFARWKKG